VHDVRGCKAAKLYHPFFKETGDIEIVDVLVQGRGGVLEYKGPFLRASQNLQYESICVKRF
jgi:hypothetical protein